ncbi:MAG: hypothetical protein K0Q70_582 [Rhodospirillales bacterium]|nr:hypothetical protein [Rhodospirillales bacterium]
MPGWNRGINTRSARQNKPKDGRFRLNITEIAR